MTCATPCHGHTSRQGRGCECDTNASRAAMFFPLHRLDGGHIYRDGMAFPIEREEDDAPLVTPETAADPLPGIARALLGFAVLILLAASAVFLSAIKGNL